MGLKEWILKKRNPRQENHVLEEEVPEHPRRSPSAWTLWNQGRRNSSDRRVIVEYERVMDNILDSVLPEKRSSRVEAGDPSQESAWVISSQKGDVVSFNRLVLKWEKKIFNLSLRILKDPNDAAETTQEVFLVAFKRIRQFRQDASFATWLYRIAVNHCTNRLHRRPEEFTSHWIVRKTA